MSASGTSIRPHVAELAFAGRTIRATVTFRRGDRLSISVHPDLRVTAVAPEGRPWEAVIDRIRRRAAWIVRQQTLFSQFHPIPSPRRYVSGETHWYLGRQYRLKVSKSASSRVWMQGGYIRVDAADRRDRAGVGEQLSKWYRHRADEVLERRWKLCAERVRSLGLSPQRPALRKMHARWGSCPSSGRVLLNPDLVMVPVACIDYVIIHELCHLKVLGHSPAFYRLLGRFMPDWERRRAKLNRFVLGGGAGR